MARNYRQAMNTGRVSALLTLLPTTLGRAWTMAEMASAAGVSTSQLRRDFVRATGLSPMHYLKRLRMEAAKDLLVNTNRSVKDVAQTVGVADISHFVRDFRDYHGCAPSAIRPVAVSIVAKGASMSDSANK